MTNVCWLFHHFFGNEKSTLFTRCFFRKTNFFSFVHFLMFTGCLQSIYGIHTFRVESLARGKAAPVDELQVQGVDNPVLLRKVNQVSFLLVYCLCKLWTLKAFFAHTIIVDFLFPSGHCNRGCKGHT